MVKELVVVSGKGGTGKTSLTASLAVLASRKFRLSLADCDVEASNLPLLLNPENEKRREKFSGSRVASIDREKCVECGLCEENCRFEAIKDFRVDEFKCEGCGVCAHVCPVSAVSLKDRLSGFLYLAETRYGPLTYARLNPGESNSGKLVSLVRFWARKTAEETGAQLVLADGPPGIGCPAIASITGVNLALLVAEPTASGLHDLRRALNLVRHFKGVKPFVAVNMWDINPEVSGEILAFCEREGLTVAGKIPFDRVVAEASANRRPVVEFAPESRVSREIGRVWRVLEEFLGG